MPEPITIHSHGVTGYRSAVHGDDVWRRRAIMAALGAAMIAVEIPTLATPFFWDEMAWGGGAQWLHEHGVWRALPGLHPPATFFGHPTALHASGALAMRLLGPSPAASHVLILAFAVLGVAATFRLGEELFDRATGVLAAVLLLLSPLYLAQAGMFLGDLPVTALGVASVVLALRGRFLGYLVVASSMVLVQKTAMTSVGAVVIWLWLRAPDGAARRRAVLHALPILAGVAFMLVERAAAGKGALLSAAPFPFIAGGWDLVARQLDEITRWLFLRQGRWLPLCVLVAALVLRSGAWRREALALGIVVVCCAYPFAVSDFLPRSMLPAMPFLYLAAAAGLFALVRSRLRRVVAITLLLLVAGNAALSSRHEGNREVDLGYRDVVAVHQEVARFLEEAHPGAVILTTFPHEQELRTPGYGYVARALDARTFSPAIADTAAADLLLVSTAADDRVAMERWATTRGWRFVFAFERAGVEATVYGKPPAKE